MLLTRLAFWSALLRPVARCWGAIVPKLGAMSRRELDLSSVQAAELSRPRRPSFFSSANVSQRTSLLFGGD